MTFHKFRVLVVAGLLAGLVAGPPTLQQVGATDPCLPVSSAPRPPIGDPEVTVAGRVIDAATGGGIAEVAMDLFRCGTSSATLVAQVASDSGGYYAFEGVTAGHYYYVEAEPNGPLEQMVVASGSQNPSDAIGLGDSATGVNFAFE